MYEDLDGSVTICLKKSVIWNSTLCKSDFQHGRGMISVPSDVQNLKIRVSYKNMTLSLSLSQMYRVFLSFKINSLNSLFIIYHLLQVLENKPPS